MSSVADGPQTYISTHYHYVDGPAVVAESTWRMAPAFGFEMSFVVVLERATILFNSSSTPSFRVLPAEGPPPPGSSPGRRLLARDRAFRSGGGRRDSRADHHSRASARHDPAGTCREAIGPRGPEHLAVTPIFAEAQFAFFALIFLSGQAGFSTVLTASAIPGSSPHKQARRSS